MAKILLLSTRVGSGHIRAADAVAEAIRRRDPGAQVLHCESLAHASPGFAPLLMGVYGTLVNRFPGAWRGIYEWAERKPPGGRLARFAAWSDSLGVRGLWHVAREFDPDYVLCTHYVPAELMARQRRLGRLRARVGILLTDYNFHPIWVQAGADQYFVASEEMAFDLRATGASAEVFATGIPPVAAFEAGARVSSHAGAFAGKDARGPVELRARLGLRPELPTILLACGGLGWGSLDDVARNLCGNLPEAQIMVVAGKNVRLLESLRNLARTTGGRLIPFGYVDNMHELMAASDFAITKCGGLTATECLAMGLPMIIVHPIPGQEERNADYLQAHGAAVRAHAPAQLVFKARTWLENPALLRRTRMAARRLFRPGAAEKIAEIILARQDVFSVEAKPTERHCEPVAACGLS